MDPVSQAALGAVAGQIAGHARLGYRAAAAGALAGALPDIDIVFSMGGDFFDQLVLHRGITHSLFFAPVAGPLIGWLVWRWEGRRGYGTPDSGRLRVWMLVVTVALLSHPLLDVLTPYGTQLLLPFTDRRFAINAMPIIDPVYTGLLLGGLLIATRWLRHRAWTVATLTLAVSSAYLGLGWHLNAAAEREATRQLAWHGITDARIAAFPTLLQIHYRRVVARTPDTDHIGYISMWRPCPIEWVSAPRHDGPEVQAFLATREGRIFDWFTMGWARYVREEASGRARLRAVDLRYGFTRDPDQSFFTTVAPVRGDGRLAGDVQTVSNPDAESARLAQMFRETYAPVCAIG
jgi:inner membrane protein